MKLIKGMLFILALFALERFCHHQTEGFRISKIVSDHPYRAEWATPPPSEEVKALLNQPYVYLSSGGQSYVFASIDGKTVIKCFKHHHMRLMPWLDSPLLPLASLRKARQKRFETIFTSFKLAHDELPEETGLLYLQLNKSQAFDLPLTLIDRLGIHHQIDLNTLTFAVQKRATLALSTLMELIQTGKTEEAKNHLISLLALTAKRTQRQIADNDPVVKRNIGFIEGRAVEIDLGSFSFDPFLASPFLQQRTFFFETVKLRHWLKKRSPALLPFFDCERQRLLSTLQPPAHVQKSAEVSQ